MTTRANHERRLAAFAITPADIAILQGQRRFATERLPKLLVELNKVFADWPEIRAALDNPAVHEVRVAHWVRVASGQLEDGFITSAQALASAFYEHHVPDYAVAICHASVMNGIIQDLRLDHPRSRWGLFGTDKKHAAEAFRLRTVLNKIAWFDLEVLLETYATAERMSRTRVMQAMAETIEREAAHAVAQVSALTADMSNTAKAMSATATRTGENAVEAASAADLTLSNSHTVATAAQDLTASISTITGQVGNSRAAAQRAVVAGRGVHESIDALSQQAEQIGRVADMIAAIAGQTNLLALNATIEAARAGDAGKGFAVVAGEVKQLANQTARSTEEITRQITAVRQATAHVAAEVGQMVAMISEIDTITTGVAEAVEQQSGATDAINHSVGETTGAAGQMSQRVAQVRHAAQETDTQAETVQRTAATLETEVSSLRKTLTHVVRTSSSTVNRRHHPGIPVDLSAQMILEGEKPFPVRIADVSESGALIRGLAKAVEPGARGRLAFQGMDLLFEVVQDRGSEECGVCLLPTETELPGLVGLLKRAQDAARAA